MSYRLDTEVLYQGTTPQGIIRNPETPAIYPASAYILDDTAKPSNSPSGFSRDSESTSPLRISPNRKR